MPFTREYDFYNFNTLQSKGNVTVTVYTTPTFNFDDNSHPLSYSLQMDSQPPLTIVPIPQEPPGGYPANWGGPDGYVANAIITNTTTFNSVSPGAHTLKVCYPISQDTRLSTEDDCSSVSLNLAFPFRRLSSVCELRISATPYSPLFRRWWTPTKLPGPT